MIMIDNDVHFCLHRSASAALYSNTGLQDVSAAGCADCLDERIWPPSELV